MILWQINDCFSWGALTEYRIDTWTRLRVNQECEKACERTKLHPRTQGLLIELPLTWHAKESKCHQFAWQVKVVPLFDWNRFGDSCRPDCSSSSSCGNCSSSSSSCSEVLCPFDECESTACDMPRLNQWYVGAHVDLGIRF